MIAKTQSCLSLYDPDATPPLEASDTPPFHCSETPLLDAGDARSLDAGGGHPLTSLQSLHISTSSRSDNVARMQWKINEVRLSRRSGRTMRYYLRTVSSLSTPPNHPLTALLCLLLHFRVNSRHRSYTYSFLTYFGTQYAGVAYFFYSSPRSIASTVLLLLCRSLCRSPPSSIMGAATVNLLYRLGMLSLSSVTSQCAYTRRTAWMRSKMLRCGFIEGREILRHVR